MVRRSTRSTAPLSLLGLPTLRRCYWTCGCSKGGRHVLDEELGIAGRDGARGTPAVLWALAELEAATSFAKAAAHGWAGWPAWRRGRSGRSGRSGPEAGQAGDRGVGRGALVGERLKRARMRWSRAGANDVMALRSCVRSERYDDFWRHRRKIAAAGRLTARAQNVAHPMLTKRWTAPRIPRMVFSVPLRVVSRPRPCGMLFVRQRGELMSESAPVSRQEDVFGWASAQGAVKAESRAEHSGPQGRQRSRAKGRRQERGAVEAVAGHQSFGAGFQSATPSSWNSRQ